MTGLQKVHPLVKQIRNSIKTEGKAYAQFETAEDANNAFLECATFYGKVPVDNLFAIKKIIPSAEKSKRAKATGLNAIVCTIRLKETFLGYTPEGKRRYKYTVAYSEGTGCYKTSAKLAEQFGLDLYA
jgi:hypothetical protein